MESPSSLRDRRAAGTPTGPPPDAVPQALAARRASDELVVTKLDRLARSLPELHGEGGAAFLGGAVGPFATYPPSGAHP